MKPSNQIGNEVKVSLKTSAFPPPQMWVTTLKIISPCFIFIFPSSEYIDTFCKNTLSTSLHALFSCGSLSVVRIQNPWTCFYLGKKFNSSFSSCKSRWRTWTARCSHLVFPISSVSRLLLARQKRAERSSSSAQTSCWINGQLWLNLCFHPDLWCCVSVNVLHSTQNLQSHTHTHTNL